MLNNEKIELFKLPKKERTFAVQYATNVDRNKNKSEYKNRQTIQIFRNSIFLFNVISKQYGF